MNIATAGEAMHATNAKMRDTRIDVFRALALLTIFINHVPGTIYENLTHRNLGFSDSAEAFVLISGMAVALAYGSKFAPGNRLLLSLKMWRRAGVLYTAHIMTTMATIAIFAAAALFLKRSELLTQINIAPLVKHPVEALFGIVTMGHQLGYNNILSMYAVMLVLTPVLLLLARISLPLMLGVSGTVWFLSGLYHVAPVNYPTEGVWFLNPLSWQFLFAIGIAGVMHVRRGGELPKHPLLIGLAVGYLVLALAWVRIPLWGIDASMGMPMVITGFDKTFLSGPRLLHVLAIAYLIAVVPTLNHIARTAPDNPLAILGKHSLPVFIAGTLLAMVAQVMKLVNPGGLPYDTLLIATGIVMQFALAYYLEWLPTIGWSKKGAAASVKPGVPAAEPVKMQLATTGKPAMQRY
ncbi:OpgC protein [Brucella intermedia M86]|uniref:OpgC protein n=3 Tax=Brucella intermedia TaxID=94625 RepID=M5JJN1_9HYPH|nr:OpgC family protein [Brucella intermedia]ELT46363.1 OpgC protein [Brucella intermedia M86]